MQIAVNSVSKGFTQGGQRGTQALEEVSLQVAAGEFISLLGPSGCGKSTVLNLIAGLEAPDTGTITVDGRPISGPGPDRVMIFQDAALFPWLTVLENVEFGLRLQGLSPLKRRELAREYLQLVHLRRFQQSYPHQLSGGMRQRAAIARALAMQPRVLLMDEPFAALDEETRTFLHKELTDIWQQTGKTILFVTHNIREAVTLSDRVVVFATRPGRVKAEFPVPLPRPRNPAAPEFLRLQGQILASLREEIEKVIKEELDLDYVVEADRLRPDPAGELESTL